MSQAATTNRSTISALFVPTLTALGAATTVFIILRERLGLFVRKVVNTVDPIEPTKEEVRSALENGVIPLTKVENCIVENKPVVEGADRCIEWAEGCQQLKTELSVVFLHGWGACRQECRPCPQRIAQSLNANLYCARLPGHGRKREDLTDIPCGETLVTEALPKELLLSALEAIKIGFSIGNKVVLIGMSTGGVLATWLASLPDVKEHVASLVLVSPAYGLGHPMYPVLKHTFATLRLLPQYLGQVLRRKLIEAVLGRTKASAARNAEHEKYNALVYPSAAILNLLDTLWILEDIDFAGITAPSIVFGNMSDPVANFRFRATEAFLQFGEAPKALYCISKPGHPHVIASEILSPTKVDEISDAAILFVKTHLVPSQFSLLWQ